MYDQPASQPHVLDDPPPFHAKLLGYGERPSWSPDGTRIAFIERNYGDVCEVELATRVVRNITHGLGEHHTFLRVLYLHNGDYLLIGPREFKHRDISRHVESELWLLDKATQTPPVPLGRRIFEGAAVSTRAPRIAYAVTGRNDPSLTRLTGSSVTSPRLRMVLMGRNWAPTRSSTALAAATLLSHRTSVTRTPK